MKCRDLAKYLGERDLDVLSQISDTVNDCRAAEGKVPVECVVVEHDWPEYEIVWHMIQARMQGTPNELEELTSKLAETELRLSTQQKKLECLEFFLRCKPMDDPFEG